MNELEKILAELKSEDATGHCICAARAARVITDTEAAILSKKFGIQWVTWWTSCGYKLK